MYSHDDLQDAHAKLPSTMHDGYNGEQWNSSATGPLLYLLFRQTIRFCLGWDKLSQA